MNCEIFGEMLGPYLEETLEEDSRGWFRRHLRECASCRDAALEREPSLLFAAAPTPPEAPEAVEACAAAVTAGIRRDRLARRLYGRRRRWMAAAAAVVVAIGGGVIWKSAYVGEASLQPAVGASAEIDHRNLPPTVEVEMPGEEVRVYQLATDEDADTAVYFIVDPTLEL